MFDMTTLTAEEITMLREGPALAGAIVAASSPNLLDMFSEMGAAVRQIVAAKKTYPNNALIAGLFPDTGAKAESPKMPDMTGATDVAGRQQVLVDQLAKIAAVADKAGADGAEYKHWVYAVAEDVAKAAKEGDFLGFGGTLVSEDEKKALTAIAAALGVTPVMG